MRVMYRVEFYICYNFPRTLWITDWQIFGIFDWQNLQTFISLFLFFSNLAVYKLIDWAGNRSYMWNLAHFIYKSSCPKQCVAFWNFALVFKLWAPTWKVSDGNPSSNFKLLLLCLKTDLENCTQVNVSWTPCQPFKWYHTIFIKWYRVVVSLH